MHIRAQRTVLVLTGHRKEVEIWECFWECSSLAAVEARMLSQGAGTHVSQHHCC